MYAVTWQQHEFSDAKTNDKMINLSTLICPRYIERFRHGQPQSREDRRQMASANGEEQQPFWWMTPSSLPSSSTPTKATEEGLFHLLLHLNVQVTDAHQLWN